MSVSVAPVRFKDLTTDAQVQLNLILITVYKGFVPDRMPPWLIPGPLYRRCEVAEWTASTEDYVLVSTGSVGLYPLLGDAIPCYELQVVDRP